MSRAVFPRPLSFRVVSEATSGSQLDSNSHELSQAFSFQQLPFRQEFASQLLHFSILSSRSGSLPIEAFSILLEGIAFGSFSGFIAIPPASTWSRARNSGVRGPPPLRSRQSPLGIQGLSLELLDQLKEHTEALELCVMALDVWCRSFPLRPFFFIAPEDRGGQQQHGPASIWQLAEVMAIVQRTREATRSSAFACELRAADSPRPLAFISNLPFRSAGLVRGWPRLKLKGDFLQYSGLVSTVHNGRFATHVAPLFSVDFWSTVLEATSKALRDGVSIQAKSDQEDRDGAKAMSDYSSSLWFTWLSLPPDSCMDSSGKFVTSSLSSSPSSHADLSIEGSYRRQAQQKAIWKWLVVVLLFLLEPRLLCPPRAAMVMSKLELLRCFVGVLLWLLPELESAPRLSVLETSLKCVIMGQFMLADLLVLGFRQVSLCRAWLRDVTLQWVVLGFVQLAALSSVRTEV